MKMPLGYLGYRGDNMKKRLFISALLATSMLSLSSCSLLKNASDNDYKRTNENAEVVELTSSYTEVKDKVIESCFGVRNKVSNTSVSVGSCVCVKQDETYSYLLTNRHVVEASNKEAISNSISVYFGDGYLKSGKVMFATTYSQREKNESDDLAVIRIETPKTYTIKPIKISESEISKGDDVISIGCPVNLTNYNTLTAGIISKDISSLGLYMHTATINPGNSGGGLFNMAGELIGLNVSRKENSESGSIIEDMYYAITRDHIKSFFEKNNFVI